MPAENLHLTLAFLGSRSWGHVDAVSDLLPEVARDVGVLETAGALWLPPRRPGVLTVALRESPALAALHADVIAALMTGGGVRARDASVSPARDGRAGASRDADRPRARCEPPSLAFEPLGLTLYRSHTGAAGGSRYERLARCALRDGGSKRAS